MFYIKKKLNKNINVFSDGCLLTTFTFNNLKDNSDIIFTEKDLKLFESSAKTKQNNNKLQTSASYLKSLFKKH